MAPGPGRGFRDHDHERDARSGLAGRDQRGGLPAADGMGWGGIRWCRVDGVFASSSAVCRESWWWRQFRGRTRSAQGGHELGREPHTPIATTLSHTQAMTQVTALHTPQRPDPSPQDSHGCDPQAPHRRAVKPDRLLPRWTAAVCGREGDQWRRRRQSKHHHRQKGWKRAAAPRGWNMAKCGLAFSNGGFYKKN